MFEYVIEKNLKFNGALKSFPKAPVRIVLHHSGASADQTVEQIHNYHINHNDWIGVGYNFLVDKAGNVYKGRGIDKIGAHCKDYNSTSIGICAIGNMETGTMPEAQKSGIVQLIRDVMAYYPSIIDIKGHRELASTDCPGKNYPLDEVKTLKMQQAAAQPVVAETKQEQGYDFASLQRLVGTKDDNIPGPKTLEACSKHVLKKKAILIVKDNIVLWVQTRLNYLGFNCGTPDGKFGKNTEKAVKDFQTAKGLEVDGVVGPQTWKRLLGL